MIRYPKNILKVFAMQNFFLSKLRRYGAYYIIGALLLLLGIPIYQSNILNPQGYGNALSAIGTGHFALYLSWITTHTLQFIVYRALLFVAFAFFLGFPFALFRIIVAQEIMGQQEQEADEELKEGDVTLAEADEEDQEDGDDDDGMPPYAWRGKGFAIIAAWSGMIGLIIYILATVASSLYLTIISKGFAPGSPLPGNITLLFSIFSIATNTVGIGLLAVATLFFGVVIARRGLHLWPRIWVAFSYGALAVAALFSGSAVAIASTPITGQSPLTTPAILLFALWMLWLGIMLVRLKPEE